MSPGGLVALFPLFALLWASALASSSSRVVVLNVTSAFARPVLFVRLAAVSGKGEEVSWFVPSAVRWVGSGPTSPGEWMSTFEVVFPNYGGSHRVYARVEYASLEEAMRNPDEASEGPSYVGRQVRGAWPLAVRGSDSRRRRRAPQCKPGDSFAGPGRWVVATTTERRSSRPSTTATTMPTTRRATAANETPFFSCDDVAAFAAAQGGKKDWVWEPDACSPRRVSDARECAKRSLGGVVVVVGDSIARQLYGWLRCVLLRGDEEKDDVRLEFRRTRGPLPKRLGDMKEALLVAPEESSENSGGVLVLNGAGLWQAAYGDVSSYEASLDSLLGAALKAPFERVVLALTTAVHPIHFLGQLDARPDSPRLGSSSSSSSSSSRRLGEEEKKKKKKKRPASSSSLANATRAAVAKRAMTLPRVAALAEIERRVARGRGVAILDAWSPTLLREDDPFEPADMRHFGKSTIAELADLLLATLCDHTTEPSLSNDDDDDDGGEREQNPRGGGASLLTTILFVGGALSSALLGMSRSHQQGKVHFFPLDRRRPPGPCDGGT